MKDDDIKTDGPGNNYLNVGNVRITYVPREKRGPDKDWANRPVIRIQAYRDANSGPLHQGAEFPVDKDEEVLEFVEAILRLRRLGQ